MKLSERTYEILKCFTSVNDAIRIVPGSLITIVSSSEHILAAAKVEEDFPVKILIHDLTQFLNVIKPLGAKAEFTFDEHLVTIKSGRQVVKYGYAQESLIKKVQAFECVTEAAPVFSFTLNRDEIKCIESVAKKLELSHMHISGIGGNALMGSKDFAAKLPHEAFVELGKIPFEETFDFAFPLENFLAVPDGDYEVSMIFNDQLRLGKFFHKKLEITFWLSMDLKLSKIIKTGTFTHDEEEDTQSEESASNPQ